MQKVDDSIDEGQGFAIEARKTFSISYVNKLKQLQVDLHSYENDLSNNKFEKNCCLFKMNMIRSLGITVVI